MRFNVSVPDDVFADLERARGDVSRSLWVRRVLEQALHDGAVVDEPRSVVLGADGPPASARVPVSPAKAAGGTPEAASFRPLLKEPVPPAAMRRTAELGGHLPKCVCPVCKPVRS